MRVAGLVARVAGVARRGWGVGFAVAVVAILGL